MPWLVRSTPSAGDLAGPGGSPSPLNLLERHASLVSKYWDLGTTGVAEQSASLLAGFDRLEAADTARDLAERQGLASEIEAVDDDWIRHEQVEVSVATAAGIDSFPVVAGAAFGHGGHPTTGLCLDLMSRVLVASEGGAAVVPPRPRVLDLGTGSGVLAIAAHRLGATDITAADIDRDAIDAARHNTTVNAVDLQLIHGDVSDVAAVAGRCGGRFDLLVANLLLVTHEEVATTAGALVGSNGVLIVSGFLADQADRVVAAYRAGRPALTVSERVFADDWCGLALADSRDVG